MELCFSDDKRVPGLLLEELWNDDLTLRESVHAALLRLLPKLESTDAHLLTQKQRDNLYNLPVTVERIELDLRIVALRTIGTIGDARALRVLKKNRPTLEGVFTHNTSLGNPLHAGLNSNRIARVALTFNPEYVALQQVLDESIAEIEARLAAENLSETHLRAAAKPADAPETLLRPASYADTTEPQQLLRASHNDTE